MLRGKDGTEKDAELPICLNNNFQPTLPAWFDRGVEMFKIRRIFKLCEKALEKKKRISAPSQIKYQHNWPSGWPMTTWITGLWLKAFGKPDFMRVRVWSFSGHNILAIPPPVCEPQSKRRHSQPDVRVGRSGSQNWLVLHVHFLPDVTSNWLVNDRRWTKAVDFTSISHN